MENRDTLIRLLLPEAYYGEPQNPVEFARIYYQWMGVSELLKWIAPIGWTHPMLSPAKYPRGEKPYAMAIGKLWITTWKATNVGIERSAALAKLEGLAQDIGGVLEPFGWGDTPGYTKDGRHVARCDRRKEENIRDFIDRASRSLRCGDNPYLLGTNSHKFVGGLIDDRSPATTKILRDLSDAISGVANVMERSKILGGKKSPNATQWMIERHEFLRVMRLENEPVGKAQILSLLEALQSSQSRSSQKNQLSI